MAYNVKDIAKRLIYRASLDEAGGELLTNLKLQKLLYYEQGFHLAVFDTPLFEDEIEAWMYGPVVPSVYEQYKAFQSTPLTIPDRNSLITLSNEEEELFNQVYESLIEFSGYGLIMKTHNETPWATTPHGKGSVISKDKIKEYFKTKIN